MKLIARVASVFFVVVLFGCNPILNNNPGADGGGPGPQGLRITPASAALSASPGAPAVQAFQAIATYPGQGDVDVTAQATWALSDTTLGGVLRGAFTSAPDHGGSAQVTASLQGKSASAAITVRFSATVNAPGGNPSLPADPSALFKGSADPARAPVLIYPPNGVIMPPNVAQLEVHFQPGNNNTLFAIDITSDLADIHVYTRCTNPINGGCIFQPDANLYEYIAGTGRGGGPLTLQVRGTDDNGSGFGTSLPFAMSFAENNVQGGLYYWTTSDNTAVMRFDFGKAGATPEVFMSPGLDNFPTCVGCHALSRDGTKLVASLGGQNDGRIVYLNNVAQPMNFQLKGDTANHIQFASFNPDGSRFVAVYGDTDAPARNMLWIHDGTTGVEIPGKSMQLSFEPDHPDWSMNGQLIAITHVGIHNTSQQPFNCGIDLITKNGTGWNAPATLVPIVSGLSRYNPNISPDSTFLLYSESTCPNGDNMSTDCHGDSDPSAKVWAVMARAGAKPLLLSKVAAPGVMDAGATDLTDTFARFSPFQEKQGAGRLFWVTISSYRRAGLHNSPTSGRGGSGPLLWMFAIDPDKIAAGQDGSFPPFFLPFQDLTTSNHIGQWAEQIVPPLG
jgi:hypothetical protein